MENKHIRLLFLLLLTSDVFAKAISLSFDDAPRRDTQYFTGVERTEKLLQELKKAKVKRAAFYINTVRLNKDDGLNRIKKYKKAGHLIGNHTHSHPNIRNISVLEYLQDFDQADQILKKNNLLDKYFRYPFLRRGKTIEEVNEIHSYILSRGYTDAFVTVDNYDFYMDHLFQNALKDKKKINFDNLRDFYVKTLYQGIEFYDELAKKAFGKSVKHVMLLHENDLAALFIGDLVKYLREKGWRIITPEESYQDTITKHFPSEVLWQGSGRVNALAREAGYQGPLISGLEDEKALVDLIDQYKVLE